MFWLLVSCGLTVLSGNYCNTVTSPQIRILDVATKESETRFIPRRVEYRNAFRPNYQQLNRNQEPLKSYVIYDDYPVRIFKEWKANFPGDFPPSGSQPFLESKRQPNEFPPADHPYQNGHPFLPSPKPTLAYRSVYSNVIKVFDDSFDNLDRSRFQSERYVRPYDGGLRTSIRPPVDYESLRPQEVSRRKPFQSQQLPQNFPKVFSPDEKFHVASFEGEAPKPPKFFYPQEGFYDTHTINYNPGNKGHRDEVEVLPELAPSHENSKNFLCGFIRVNQRQFPEGGPCGRSEEDVPVVSPEYPEYFDLPSDKIPLEHRRQLFQVKRIKRSRFNESDDGRRKREAGFGYSGYGGWSSPFGYEGGYYGDNYPSHSGYGGYGGSYGSGYSRNSNRNRNQNYRNRYYGGSRSNYDEYDDEYQNNDDSNSRGLTGYLTNGGRRYKNRKNNNDDDDDNDNDNNNRDDNENDNRNEDSDEETERQNNNRRDANERRNERNRRRNNNNNNNNNNSNNNNYNDEDDDYRDNRRNNQRQNNNSRRNNYNRRNNERYGYNNRMRYDNGYSNHGYGNGYGSNGYGNSYGGNGYGGNYGGSYGGYGSGYGNGGGYGYGGGYGNSFGSF